MPQPFFCLFAYRASILLLWEAQWLTPEKLSASFNILATIARVPHWLPRPHSLPAHSASLWLSTWPDRKSSRVQSPGLCMRELVDWVNWIAKSHCECGRHHSMGWCSRPSLGESWASLFFLRHDQLLPSCSLGFPPIKDCTFKPSKNKSFLEWLCKRTLSHQGKSY